VHDDSAIDGLVDHAPGPEELADRQRARPSSIRSSHHRARPPLVFVLYELEEMRWRRSGHLDLAPGTVASRLRRAREAFQTAATRLRGRHDRAPPPQGRGWVCRRSPALGERRRPSSDARRAIAAAIGVGTIARPRSVTVPLRLRPRPRRPYRRSAPLQLLALRRGGRGQGVGSIVAKLIIGFALTTGVGVGIGVAVHESAAPRASIGETTRR